MDRMSDMGINSADLDNYITGHYGEDQFKEERRKKGANLKTYAMVFQFPEVLVKHMTQVVTIKANRPDLALKMGYQNVRKRAGIARKQLTKFQVSCVISEDPKEAT